MSFRDPPLFDSCSDPNTEVVVMAQCLTLVLRMKLTASLLLTLGALRRHLPICEFLLDCAWHDRRWGHSIGGLQTLWTGCLSHSLRLTATSELQIPPDFKSQGFTSSQRARKSFMAQISGRPDQTNGWQHLQVTVQVPPLSLRPLPLIMRLSYWLR